VNYQSWVDVLGSHEWTSKCENSGSRHANKQGSVSLLQI